MAQMFQELFCLYFLPKGARTFPYTLRGLVGVKFLLHFPSILALLNTSSHVILATTWWIKAFKATYFVLAMCGQGHGENRIRQSPQSLGITFQLGSGEDRQ